MRVAYKRTQEKTPASKHLMWKWEPYRHHIQSYTFVKNIESTWCTWSFMVYYYYQNLCCDSATKRYFLPRHTMTLLYHYHALLSPSPFSVILSETQMKKRQERRCSYHSRRHHIYYSHPILLLSSFFSHYRIVVEAFTSVHFYTAMQCVHVCRTRLLLLANCRIVTEAIIKRAHTCKGIVVKVTYNKPTIKAQNRFFLLGTKPLKLFSLLMLFVNCYILYVNEWPRKV